MKAIGGLRWVVCAAGFALTLSSASPLRAQSTAHAGELYLSADFEGARREARQVVTAADATREDLVGALRLLGAVETMVGTPERATEAAQLLVRLDPTAEPAAGAPEEASALVAAARAAPPPALALTFGTGVAIATPTGAPTLATALTLECEDAAGRRTVSGVVDAPLRQPVDATHDVHCRAEVRTANGIVLAEDAQTYGAAAPSAAPRGDDSTLWIVLGVSGGVLLTAIVIGVSVAATSGPADATFAAPVVIGW